ncbi:MAG: hypothetical protein U1E27_02745, partial [Kiritimatiellia bacterium]|nr:hypothetical protein [Kiritimatiellia bacterium]
MTETSLNEALEQVRTLREMILEKQIFRGFSGRARMAAGCAVLLAAILLSLKIAPRTPTLHLAVWAVVLIVALTLNFGALAYAFFFDRTLQRDPARLKPALDILPPLAAGAIFSLALVLHEQYDFLFGTWMILYGLAHLAARRSLPATVYAVGLFYFACGMLCLLWPGISFLNPWPMALAFFPGEIAGGLVFSA